MQCQSNGSTNYVKRGVVHQTLKKYDWLAISWYIDFYELMNINISSIFFPLNHFHKEKAEKQK